MAYQVEKGVLTAATTTPPVDVTVNTSFVPKVVIFFGRGGTTTDGWDTVALAQFGVAVGTGTNDEASVCFVSSDNASTSKCKRQQRNDRSFVRCNANSADDVTFELKSFNTSPDGFTVTFHNVSNAQPIHWVAIGGDELTGAALLQIQGGGTDDVTNSPISYSDAGVSFTPDAAILFGSNNATAPGSSLVVNAAFCLGFVDGTNETAIGIHSSDNVTTTNTDRIQQDDRCYLGLSSSGVNREASFNSFITDGISLTWHTEETSDAYIWALLLKGGNYEVGTETNKTTTSGTKKTTLAFQPSGLITAGVSRTAATGVQSEARITLGASDGTNDGNIHTSDQNNLSGVSNTERYIDPTDLITHSIDGASTIISQGHVDSFLSDGVDIYWDDGAGGNPSTTARQFTFFAMGGAGGETLTAVPGSYTLTGTAAATTKGHLLTAVPGSYTLTGTAANLEKGTLLTAVPGSYTLTGTAAATTKGHLLTAVPGVYTLTGTAADLIPPGQSINIDPGSYTLTGTAAATTKGHLLTAVPGVYTLTGTAADLIPPGQSINIDPGSYTLTGTAAATTKGHLLTAVPGVYTLTGTAADLIPPGQSINIDPGSYTLTGTAAATTKGHLLTAVPGSYTLTGTAANLEKGTLLTAVPGSYTLTGTAAATTKGHLLTAVPGVYTLTGTAASLIPPGEVLTADPGSYTLTGTTTDLKKGHLLTAVPGVYTLTGTAATTTKNTTVTADPGSYTLTGTTTDLKKGHLLTAVPGVYTLTGTAATTIKNTSIVIDVGVYNQVGTNVTLRRGFVIPIAPGVYTLTGTNATLTAGLSTIRFSPLGGGRVRGVQLGTIRVGGSE